MKRIRHFKQYCIIILTIALLAQFNPLNFADTNAPASLYTVEKAIHNGTFDTITETWLHNSVQDIPLSDMYQVYFDALLMTQSGEYSEALDSYKKTLNMARQHQNIELEKYILEKLMTLNMAIDRQGDYQEYAMRLESIVNDPSDPIYIQSIYTLAYAHFVSYSDEIAMNYLSTLKELSEADNYDLGLAHYYALSAEIAYSYEDYDQALQEYELAYQYALSGDGILGLPYPEYIQVQFADTLNALDEYQKAYDTLAQIDVDSLPFSPVLLREYHYLLADTSNNLKRYEEAIMHLNEVSSFDHFFQGIDGAYLYEEALYSHYAYAYNGLGEYKKASEYFIKYFNYDAEYYSDENYSESVSDLFDYETRALKEEIRLKTALKQTEEKTVQLQRRFLITGGLLIILLIISIIILLRMNAIRERIKKKLYIETITDHMTHLYNRNHIIKLLEKNISDRMCVILADIDNFKDINDTYGHLTGDEVLIRVAQTIQQSISPQDHVGRYGGEEFLILLNDVDLESGAVIAQRILNAVESLVWNEGIKTTLSIGLLQGYGTESDILLHKVDKLMYEAKRTGKNRMVY